MLKGPVGLAGSMDEPCRSFRCWVCSVNMSGHYGKLAGTTLGRCGPVCIAWRCSTVYQTSALIPADIEHLAADLRSGAGERDDLMVGCLHPVVGAIRMALRLPPAGSELPAFTYCRAAPVVERTFS